MENVSVFTMILNAFSQGGIWMWAILAIQIVSMAIIAERVIQLYLLRKPSQRKWGSQLEGPIRSGNFQQALSLTHGGRRNPIGRVVSAGLKSAQSMSGKEDIRSRMDELLLVENEKLDKRTGFLAMLGNVGTLLGLLGTIVGLIAAFASVSALDPVEKSSMLTKGISMAMNTTAYGLIMAIPALVMYAVLQNRSESLKQDLNQAAFRAFNWMNFNFDQVGKKSAKKPLGN